MPVVVGPDGQAHWVDPETAAALQPSVAAPVAPTQLTGKRVAMIDDVGQMRELDQAEVPSALAAGWRSETPEEFRRREAETRFGSLGQQIESGAEAFVRGGTGGLSDAIIAESLQAFDPAAAERFRQEATQRQEQLGALGTGLEIGGALISPLNKLVPGLGAASEAKSIVGAGIQGAKRLAVEGAVQGGIFGAGGALSEAALAPGGNYDDLASKMIAGGVGGGAFGLVTGGLLGFAGGAGLKAAERGADKLAGPGGLKRLLEETSDEAMGRALGAKGAGVPEDRITKMVRTMKSTTLDDGSAIARFGDDKATLAARVKLGERQAAKRIDAVAHEVDDAIEGTVKSAGYRGDPNALRPDLGRYFEKLDTMVQKAETLPPSLAKRVRQAVKETDPLRKAYLSGETTLGDVITYRRQIDKVLFPEKAGGGITVAKANAAELQAVRSELESVVERTIAKAEPLSPGALERYQAAKATFGALKDASKFSAKAVKAAASQNRFSLIEAGAGVAGTVASLATGNVLPLVGGAAISIGRQQWRARGEQALAIIADRVAKSDTKLNAAVSRYFKRAAEVRRGSIGAFSAQEDRKSRQERALRQKKSETRADAYQRRLTEISRYNAENDPDMPALASAAPQTAIATAARQARARAYLIAKAPTDVIGDDPLQPQLKKQLADPVKLEHWSRRLEAVEDPVGVIQRGLDYGTLTREHVETIKAVDPQLFESLKAKVMDQLATSKEKLPYQQRIRLGVLLGIPTDKSLRPDQVARTQMMFQKLRAQQPQQKPAPSPSPGKAGASPYASESQRLEANIPPQ